MNNIGRKYRFRARQQYLLSLVLLLLLLGCADRLELPSQEQEGVPSGMVRFAITPSITSSGVVNTRSTPASNHDKELSGAIRVLVFDSANPATAILKQTPSVATFDDASGRLMAILNEESSPSYLCVVANISSADASYIDGLTTGMSLSGISAKLRFSLPASPPFRIEFPLVMSGWSGEISEIKKNGSPSALNASIAFRRSVARIDIDGFAAQFTIHGAMMSNAPRYGFTLPQPALPVFGITDLSTHGEVSNTSGGYTFSDMLFAFESKGSIDGVTNKASRVIIRGTPKGSSTSSYYPIDIIYPDPLAPDPIAAVKMADIVRNTIYTIKLTSVTKDGYRTVEEAARSEAFNAKIDMDIVVTDPLAHDITTNGKQYLGVTNSEFVLYPLNDEASHNLHILSVSYTCDPGWSVGAITLPSGMTFAGTTSSVARLDVSPSTVMQDIVATIPASFTTGNIILHIGNLRKEIVVRRMTPAPSTGGVLSDYYVAPNLLTDYKVGEVISPSSATSWLKLSNSADVGQGNSSLNDYVMNPEGGVYVHAEPNVGFGVAATTREASIYVTGAADNQRIKVLVQQDFFDLYSGIKQIEPYSYVGTFHRWNETAERLIRIFASASILGGIGANAADLWWQADVVAGREFIVIDTEETSPSSGTVIWNSGKVNHLGANDLPSPSYASSQLLESAPGAQLNSRLRSIRREGTESIYFRVGLVGKLASATAQPRYGLITITAGVKGKAAIIKHNLYVRQGEAPDYLMRPWDPSTKRPDGTFEFRSPTRPKARKITPYNLTYIGNATSDVVDEGKNGYGFVDHPSQGGCYFLASGTSAIKPTSPSVAIPEPPTFDLYNPWNTNWETCPKGYRRPNDGKGRIYADAITFPQDLGGNNPLYPDDIDNSEIRQSLWLYPLHGGFKTDFSNQLRGFLADGFFDRRAISESNGLLPAKDYAIVERGEMQAAYRGFLLFNPINYASVFLPLGGDYSALGQTGSRNQGDALALHTSTPGASSNDGWTIQAGYNNSSFGQTGWVFDIYQKTSSKEGYSIRCIKDDQPLIGTDGTPDTSIEGVDTSTPSLLAVRHIYTATDVRSLQSQIEEEYSTLPLRQRINSLTISGDKQLTAADYLYLNRWADGTEYGGGTSLRHLNIRGKGNVAIPSGAFTSNRWSHIQLFDVATIHADAFAGVTGMSNLSLLHMDGMTVDAAAFNFATSSVQLHLYKGGVEHAAANLSAKQWRGHTWSVIKGQ